MWAFGDDGEPDGTVRWPIDGDDIWRDTVEDSGLVRIHFAVPDEQVRTWDEFATEEQVDAKWRNYLETNRQADPDRWRVVLEEVPSSRWLHVEARSTDSDPWEPLPMWGTGSWNPKPSSMPPRPYDHVEAQKHIDKIRGGGDQSP